MDRLEGLNFVPYDAPQGLDYLSYGDNEILQCAQAYGFTAEVANEWIVKLLLRIRDMSKAEHAACRY